MSIFQEITELQELRRQKIVLERREEILAHPALSDLALIPRMYRALEKRYPEEPDSRTKKQFVLLVLYLFCPSALAGRNISRGVRAALTRLFRFQAPSAISNIYAKALIWYCQYKDFREETDELYNYLAEKLLQESTDAAPTGCCDIRPDVTEQTDNP